MSGSQNTRFSAGENERCAAGNSNVFITSIVHGQNPLFKKEEFARLFLNVLEDNRKKARFLLHEFVAMPDHFHLIVTPATDVSLEKAVQYIKGGFSFRAKKELGLNSLVWQEGFKNHRIRDSEDYERHREYIQSKSGESRIGSDAISISVFISISRNGVGFTTAGAKAHFFRTLFAALKGRSSTISSC